MPAHRVPWEIATVPASLLPLPTPQRRWRSFTAARRRTRVTSCSSELVCDVGSVGGQPMADMRSIGSAREGKR